MFGRNKKGHALYERMAVVHMDNRVADRYNIGPVVRDTVTLADGTVYTYRWHARLSADGNDTGAVVVSCDAVGQNWHTVLQDEI
jgi:hypothetical protein